MSTEPRTPGEQDAYDQGREFGRLAEEVRGHTLHFVQVNGSIERAARSLEELTAEVRTSVSEARVREERATSAAVAVAEERRQRQENADRSFTKREKLFGVLVAFVLLVVGVAQLIPLVPGS